MSAIAAIAGALPRRPISRFRMPDWEGRMDQPQGPRGSHRPVFDQPSTTKLVEHVGKTWESTQRGIAKEESP